MMTDVLIVGCGQIAGGYDRSSNNGSYPLSHAGAYMAYSDVRILSCVDPDEELRRRFSDYWSVPFHYSSLNDIPVGTKFDVVSVCTPVDTHELVVNQLLRFEPKVIFMEKPLAQDSEAGKRIATSCARHDIRLVVNYSRHWDSVLNDLIAKIKNGQYGELRRVVGLYSKGIRNNGSHLVEILLRLCGPLEIESSNVRGTGFANDDPDLDVVLRSSSGVCINILASNASDFSQFELLVTTSDAELRMLDGGLRWEVRQAQEHPFFNGYRMLGKPHYFEGGYLPVMAIAVGDVLNTTSNRCHNSVEAAITVQQICEAMIRKAV